MADNPSTGITKALDEAPLSRFHTRAVLLTFKAWCRQGLTAGDPCGMPTA